MFEVSCPPLWSTSRLRAKRSDMRTVTKVFILLFLCLLSNSSLQAQLPATEMLQLDATNISRAKALKDGWRFHNGHNPEWALPTYIEDEGWQQATTSFFSDEEACFLRKGFDGSAWFRNEFYIDSSLVKKLLAFRVESDGALSVYLNGDSLHTFGSFSDVGKPDYRNPQRYPVFFTVDTPGTYVLAIRFENNEYKDPQNIDEESGFDIYVLEGVTALEDYRQVFEFSAVVLISVAFVFFALAFVHFILFLFHRRTRANFYFGLFNISVFAMVFCVFLGLNLTSSSAIENLQYVIAVALFAACFSLVSFVHELFGTVRWPIYTALILGIINFLTLFSWEEATDLISLITGVFASIYTIILIIRAMLHKKPGSRILGAGILFFFGFLVSVVLFFLIQERLTFSGGFALFLMGLVLCAVFSIPFSISIYLAWEYSVVRRSLERQLQQVEILSEKTIKQEQEKQLLLQNRKAELEQEVARRTRQVEEQKNRIELQHEELKSEKKKSDDLLLNILPAEIADELKQTGNTKARSYDQVTVMFTDFVNFTQISEQLAPEQLVEELHSCFKIFDDIMARYGMEKIKTIGDAYLAVSGLPVQTEKHATQAVKAALEILRFIENRQGTAFRIRIGIHSGPLVAGIVGVKKFAYDIWGDTVNIASRMESSGVPGKINISEATYQLVSHEFECTYRGKISAKNKGQLDMYFVEQAL